MKKKGWEIRRTLRWGSEHIKMVASKREAISHAKKDIKQHGNVGRIEVIDTKENVVYYDIYEEMS